MKKQFLTLLFSLVAFISFAQTYYVDPAGSDANNGTSTSTPWQTISKVNSSAGAGSTVLFKRGGTFVGTVTPGASNITYDAYGNGARPILTGAQVLTSWTDNGGGVWYASGITTKPKVLTINGKVYARGRTPDYGQFWNIDSRTGSGGNASITANELTGNYTGATVIHRPERWIINNETITSHTGTTINFNYSFYAPKQDWKFQITDHLSTVTAYGEWYWDDATDRLYVYFGSAGTSNVTISTRDYIFNITTKNNTTVRNLELSYSNADLFRQQGCLNTRIERCLFQYGFNGFQLSFSASDGLYLGYNTFRYMLNNGIRTEDGNVSGLTIEYNDLHQIGFLYGEGGSNDGNYEGFNGGGDFITVGPTTNAVFRFNTMDTVGYIGIKGLGGQNTIVQNNVINQFCFHKDDGSAIYGYGWGTNKRWTGNIIMNGAIDAWKGTNDNNVYAYGLYTDNNAQYYTIDNNTVINTPKGALIHDSKNVSFTDNVIYAPIDWGLWVLHSGLGHDRDPGMHPRNLTIKRNVIVGLGTTQRILSVENLANDDDISNWGVIDSNYYARPLDDGAKIYAGYSSGANYTLSGWRAFEGFDLNSRNSPKTYPSNIVGSDSVKIYYNPSNSTQTYPIDGRWVDHKGSVFLNSVTLSPYRSVVLFADSASGAYVPPPTGNADTGYVTWDVVPSAYELLPGQEAYGGIRKKLSAVAGFGSGTAMSRQSITEGESFEIQSAFRATPYAIVGLHPFDPGFLAGNPNVLFMLRFGNTTPPQTESGILPYDANVSYFSEYEPATVDSPWYRIKYESGRIKYGYSTNGGTTWTDFYTSTNIPTSPYKLIFDALDPGDNIRRVRKVSAVGVANLPPTVTLGQNITITLPTSQVSINGAGSDPDGSIVSWQWTKISGPSGGTIVSPTSMNTNITGLQQGTYSYSLRATDNYGATGADTIGITVNPALNVAPTVNAGSDRTIQLPTNSVTVNAVASDPDGSIASYAWQKLSGTGGTIQNPASATTNITNLSAGTYVYRVTVVDNGGLSASDTMNITVSPAPNTPPLVNAGVDQNITLPTSSVTFNGSATDADGTVVSYLWTKVSGPAGGTIVSPAAASTLVTGLATAGTYTFRLLATDNAGGTGSDFINVVVAPVPVGTAYVAAVTKTWGTEIPVPRLKVRIAFTDGTQQTISYRNGAYVKGVRARYKTLEGGNRLVVIINYSDNTVQEIYKK